MAAGATARITRQPTARPASGRRKRSKRCRSNCATRRRRRCGRWRSATRVLPPETPDHADGLHARRDALESGLVYAGFVAIRDPLRDDVKDAVAECRQAGIEVKMITGDNVETARAIACEVGLIDRRDAPIDTPARSFSPARSSMP